MQTAFDKQFPLQAVRVNHPDQIQSPILYVSEIDARKFFQSEARGYLQIAHHIFKAAPLAWMREGKIGLTGDQASLLRPYTFGIDQIVVTPLDKLDLPEICRVEWEVCPKYRLSRNLFISAIRIQEMVARIFADTPLSLNQTATLLFDGSLVELKVMRIKTSSINDAPSACGVATWQTLNNFHSASRLLHMTQSPVDDRRIKAYHFKVEVLNNNNLNCPVMANEEILTSSLKINYYAANLILGDESFFSNEEQSQLKITLQEVSYNHSREAAPYYLCEMTSLYTQCFHLTDRSKIVFHTDPKEIIIYSGYSHRAEAVEFHLVKRMASFADLEKKERRTAWLSKEEIIKELRRQARPFCLDMNIPITLSSGQYQFRAVSVNGARTEADPLKKPRWILSQKTLISVTIDPAAPWFLLDSPKVYKSLSAHFLIEGLQAPLEVQQELQICQNELTEALHTHFTYPLVEGQQLFVPLPGGLTAEVKIDTLKLEGTDEHALGKIEPSTVFTFETTSECPSFLIPSNPLVEIDNPMEKLEELGLGGLSEEMERVVRYIFFSHGPRKEEMEQLGLKPEKGLLFFGPAGTGKTRFASALAQMLGSCGQRVVQVSGPSLFSKWLGKSEKNVRRLFLPAKQAEKQLGMKSPLYVIIIDEIDSLLEQRKNDGNRARNGTVAEFLAQMDGLEEQNNILVIGMTNRRDFIDPAVLRPGRFGLQIEIGLPKEIGRCKIFAIHTKKIRESGRLSDDVDFSYWSKRTEGWSGAEIEGLIKKGAMICFETKADKMTKKHLEQAFDEMVKQRGRSNLPPDHMYI